VAEHVALIPELAVVELERSLPDGRRVLAYGVVVAPSATGGWYQVEVVDPATGGTDIAWAASEDLRVTHII
jgi:hypothetical protein